MQAPGVRFSVDESVEIATALVWLGVDIIECGQRFASFEQARRVSAVVLACGYVPVLAHAHAHARNEDIASVCETGARWVGIFAGVNDISFKSRISSSLPAQTLMRQAVVFAKSLGLRVWLTVVDGSRTPIKAHSIFYQCPV